MMVGVFILYISSICGSIFPVCLAIVSEVILTLVLSIALLFKDFFIKKAKSKQNKDKHSALVVHINEVLLAARIIRNTLILHLIIVLLYEILPDDAHSAPLDKIMIPGLLFIFIFLIFAFEVVRISLMKRKINTENWLAIVNETGGVIGKVALSVSQGSKKHYLHPVIRIALIYKGLFYLYERPEHFLINPGKIDYPFEKYVYYNHSLDDAVGNVLQKAIGRKDLPVKFVFRYLFKTDTANRLVYLYTCKIEDEKTMNQINLGKGKLWTEKQIEENIGTGIFSECFEKEYEILKNTVLMAEKIIAGTTVV